MEVKLGDLPVESNSLVGEVSAKRILDITGSVIGLLLAAAPMAVIAALIKLDSPGPAIFRQTRLGRDRKPFTFYKFRSMKADADQTIHRDHIKGLIETPEIRDDSLYKIEDDTRVTRIGSILRRTSLDELPQLFNILKGEMSLVGPRPAIPYEVKMYKEWYFQRFKAVPGLTGYWQVCGRGAVGFEDMIRLDIDYVERQSFWLDIGILFRTVLVVLNRKGAW